MAEADLTSDQLLSAYAAGYFPMAGARDSRELRWYNPEQRGILPLEGFHVPASLRKFLRQCSYEVKTDSAFEAVIRACAGVRPETWINDTIIALYCELARRGFAHSVECWQEGRLMGGLYGVSLGSAFFGESMFSLATNASKVALVHLVERLKAAGYTLLDTQFANEHLTQFGCIEIAREDYLQLLAGALRVRVKPGQGFG